MFEQRSGSFDDSVREKVPLPRTRPMLRHVSNTYLSFYCRSTRFSPEKSRVVRHSNCIQNSSRCVNVSRSGMSKTCVRIRDLVRSPVQRPDLVRLLNNCIPTTSDSYADPTANRFERFPCVTTRTRTVILTVDSEAGVLLLVENSRTRSRTRTCEAIRRSCGDILMHVRPLE